MIAYLNEATNIRPMSEFKNYIRKVYIAGERISISSVVDYVNESDEIFHSVFGMKMGSRSGTASSFPLGGLTRRIRTSSSLKCILS